MDHTDLMADKILAIIVPIREQSLSQQLHSVTMLRGYTIPKLIQMQIYSWRDKYCTSMETGLYLYII